MRMEWMGAKGARKFTIFLEFAPEWADKQL